jgi:hypothetical protein
MRAGQDLESCLARVPQYADELRPLLEMVPHVALACPPAVPAATRAAGETRMQAALAQKLARQQALPPVLVSLQRWARSLWPNSNMEPKPAWYSLVAALAVLLFAAGAATVAAASDSLPGDVLYPIKVASQNVQVVLTFDSTRQELLVDQIHTQRRLDVGAALEASQEADVRFQGILQEIRPGSTTSETVWIVGGLPVTVQGSVQIAGQPQVGGQVEVQARLSDDGLLLATHISVEPGSEPPFTGPTETPEPTKTPAVTLTPAPTLTPTPTGASESSGAPELEGESDLEDGVDANHTPEPDDELGPGDDIGSGEDSGADDGSDSGDDSDAGDDQGSEGDSDSGDDSDTGNDSDAGDGSDSGDDSGAGDDSDAGDGSDSGDDSGAGDDSDADEYSDTDDGSDTGDDSDVGDDSDTDDGSDTGDDSDVGDDSDAEDDGSDTGEDSEPEDSGPQETPDPEPTSEQDD